MGHHVIQFLLFIARYFLFLNTYVANFASWLVSGDSLGIDDSYRIFNVDCRVSLPKKKKKKLAYHLTTSFYAYSIHNIPRSGRFHMKILRPAFGSSVNTCKKNNKILMVYGLIFLWRLGSLLPMIFG